MGNILARKIGLLAGDAFLIAAAFYLAPALRFGEFIEINAAFEITDVASLLCYLFFFYLFDLYNVEERFVRGVYVVRCGAAVAAAGFFIAALFFFFRVRLYSVSIFLINSLLIFLFCLGWRIAFERLSRRARRPLRMVVLGAGETGCAFQEMIQGRREYEIVGFLDDDERKWGSRRGCAPVLGGSDLLPSLVRENRIDKVIVAVTGGLQTPVYKKLIDAKFSGVNVYEMPTFIEMAAGKIPVRYVSEPWLAHAAVSGVRRSVYTTRIKRMGDIFLSLVMLPLALPVMAALWVAVRADSPGPGIFVQRRVGFQEKPFALYKFRTMRHGSEGERAHAGRRDDPRITRVGKILRLLRLDELPQLWNVLRGDMSFIGPRALMEEEVNEFSPVIPYFSLRHAVRPGLTGWAQVNYPHGATKEDALEKLQYDLYYIKNMSFLLDLHILLRTVRVVLFGKGAR